MIWDNYLRKYYDIGEEGVITFSKKNMSNIMLALLRCDGELCDSHSLEKKTGSSDFQYKPHLCSVVMRIRLPRGSESEFERISGFKPTIPTRVEI